MLAAILLIEAFFYAAPVEVLPLIDQSARMDLFDLYKDGQKAEVLNRFGGVTTLTAATDSTLQLRLTECSTWSMQVEHDSILTVRHTFYATDTLTTVQRYTPHWRKLAE